jgi:hypothetical protein
VADLPPIPDEALGAAKDALARLPPKDYDAIDKTNVVITAAWPHLYAAALRHVAAYLDEWRGPAGYGVLVPAHLWADRFREMADDVSRGEFHANMGACAHPAEDP